MTTAGKAHRMPWRVTWYVRDPVTGRPSGGGRRAFALEQSAVAFAQQQRDTGWTVECWREDTLPGTS